MSFLAKTVRPCYPKVLEEWWIRQAAKIYNQPDHLRCFHQARFYIQRLTDYFTIERGEGLQKYSINQKDLVGYGLFFFPQTFMRVSMIMTELFESRGMHFHPEKNSIRMLDLGAGTGAAGLAVAASLTQKKCGKIQLLAVDQSLNSLRFLKQVAYESQVLWPTLRVDTFATNALDFEPKDKRPWDIIITSFALNEFFEQQDEATVLKWLQSFISRLSHKGVLIICEPATFESSRNLAFLRENILDNKWAHIMAPCLHQHTCPMLNEKTWCHEVRDWQVPESVEYINRKLFRSINDLKWSFLAITRTPPTTQSDSVSHTRLVSPMHELKGKILTTGCAADGQLHVYEKQTRDLDKKEKKDFLKMERGDILKWSKLETLGDGTLRSEKKPTVEFGFEKITRAARPPGGTPPSKAPSHPPESSS